MKIISWNVNGIRAAYKKGLMEFIQREDPDVFCVQETKALREQCEPVIHSPPGLTSYWFSASKKKGYSGVATYSLEVPLKVTNGLGIADYDTEGRVLITEHEGFTLYNIYFPNGGSGQERHDYKQRFLKDLFKHLKPLVTKGKPLIVVGDYNIAHREIDVFDPVRLAEESGFLLEERKWLDGFFEMGFVDTFRHFHPKAKERYTWWNQIQRARLGNRGWRIDYICITTNLIPHLKRADILEGVEGSDHCPVMIELG
jgi:exodeoxyribonuclease-3